MRKYSWKPDVPDARDYRMSVAPRKASQIPPSYDMRNQCPEVYDQGELGSCTANAVCAAFQFTQKEEGKRAAMPSRLFVYYNTRVIQDTVAEDSGASLRDSIKAIAKWGVCLESLVPYDIYKFTRKPSKTAYTKAEANKVSSYARVPQREDALKIMLSDNNPIVFGFSVYDSFEGPEIAQTGLMSLPDYERESMLGGHAVTLVGYDDSKRWFIVRNSWGEDWGDGGYFYMPYDYVLNPDLADDFWAILDVP